LDPADARAAVITNMTTIMILQILVLVAANSMFAQDQARRASAIPAFEDYPAHPVTLRTLPVPKFRPGNDVWPDADPKFRQATTAAALDGPNFAGRFTIATISCGTGCLYIAVINEENGDLSTNMPFYSLLVGPFEDKRGEERVGRVSYRLHSRLLIASGCFDATTDDDGYCARAYYEWKGGHFQLITRVPLNWHVRLAKP
jgi:hypothetical protein